MPSSPKSVTLDASATGQSRIIGLDICRSAAIAIVMFSHSITESGLYAYFDYDTGGLEIMRILIQIAPPIFINLFGSMLEIIYRPRINAGQGREVTARLLTRALQCYLLYVFSLLALLAIGVNSSGYTVRSALLMGVTPYTDILKFYTLALAFAPVLLFLRKRLGLPVLAMAALAIHFAHPLISQIIVPGHSFTAEYFNPVIGFLIGGNQFVVGGPSVLHGMTFVVWGMLLGRVVTVLTQGSSPKEILNATGTVVLMYLVAVSTMVVFWNFTDPQETLRYLTNMGFRNYNHPMYFAFGMAGAMTAIIACLVIYDAHGARVGRSIAFAGKTSLFTFSFGNVLLYLAPSLQLGAAGSWIYAVALFLLICIQSYAFNWLQTRSPQTPNRFVAWFQRLQSRINAAVGRAARLVAPRYAGILGW